MADRWATFDCYGTLIDWELGIARTLTEVWSEADESTIERLIRQRERIESEIERDSAAPYRNILEESLLRLAGEENLSVPSGMENALADSLPAWPPFEEVPDALRELRIRGWKLAILSNIDPEFLAASIELIGVPIDETITAADAGSYKPAHGHWNEFDSRVGPDRRHHVHVGASAFADLSPCAELGITAVWINRLSGATNVPRAAELPDLRELSATLDGLVPSGDGAVARGTVGTAAADRGAEED